MKSRCGVVLSLLSLVLLATQGLCGAEESQAHARAVLGKEVTEVFIPRCLLWESLDELIRQLEISAGVRIGCRPLSPLGFPWNDARDSKISKWFMPQFTFERGTVAQALDAYCRQSEDTWWALSPHEIVLLWDSRHDDWGFPNKAVALKQEMPPLEREAIGFADVRALIAETIGRAGSWVIADGRDFVGRAAVSREIDIAFSGGSLASLLSYISRLYDDEGHTQDGYVSWAFQEMHGGEQNKHFGSAVCLALPTRSRVRRGQKVDDLVQALVPRLEHQVYDIPSSKSEVWMPVVTGTEAERGGYTTLACRRADQLLQLRRRHHYHAFEVERAIVKSGVIRQVVRRADRQMVAYLLSLGNGREMLTGEVTKQLLSLRPENSFAIVSQVWEAVPAPWRFGGRYASIWETVVARADTVYAGILSEFLQARAWGDFEQLTPPHDARNGFDDVWNLSFVWYERLPSQRGKLNFAVPLVVPARYNGDWPIRRSRPVQDEEDSGAEGDHRP